MESDHYKHAGYNASCVLGKMISLADFHHVSLINFKNSYSLQGLYSWAFYVVNTDLPKYMNDVLHIPIQKNAVYSSVPRIANTLVSLVTGFISDWMHETRKISITTVRKTFAALCIYSLSNFKLECIH